MTLKALLLASLLASGAGTRADRQALFDYLVEATLSRESFSAIKNDRLGLDVREAMLSLEDEFLAADTDPKLFHALVKLSNSRKDRHLSVDPVPGGLSIDPVTDYAPVRFLPDGADPNDRFLFVSDVVPSIDADIELGDRLVAVNGREDFASVLEPYIRYSTIDKLWWELAKRVSERSYLVPPELYREALELTLARRNGERYTAVVPYGPADGWQFLRGDDRRYTGFDIAYSTPTYDLYRNFAGKDVLLIVWHGFREHLVEDVDRLVDYGVEHDLLEHAIVFDATRSRGGSKGAYAVQRLSPRPFRTTFGNLRLSEVTEPFLEEKQRQFDSQSLRDGTATETVDDGSWLMEWLNEDVRKGLERGQSYSNDVPFKLAHLPKYADGIVHPAEVHFRGPLVVLLGPHGGSHLDQFASIVADNDLGHIVGTPAGGYSNTWEWEEVVRFPTTGAPVVHYMWSIGHTIRPNGEVLEGNPAEVDELVPLTRDNFERYHDVLLERAYRHLGLP